MIHFNVIYIFEIYPNKCSIIVPNIDIWYIDISNQDIRLMLKFRFVRLSEKLETRASFVSCILKPYIIIYIYKYNFMLHIFAYT